MNEGQITTHTEYAHDALAKHGESVRERLVTPAWEKATRARRIMRGSDESGQGRIKEAMSTLAEAFHVLDGVPGVRPWDCVRLYDWATTSGAPTGATREAVRCVISIWNTSSLASLDEDNDDEDARLGPFDVVTAMARWDAGNQTAFSTWAADPWWP